MGNIATARQKIKEAKDNGETILNLTMLGLTAQELASLIPSIAEIPGLKEVDLAENRIDILPDTIRNLTMLEELNLEGNELQGLPDSISDLQNLKNIFLADNDIEQFPTILTSLTNLEYADLRANAMQDLPRSITSLGNLNIDLSNNPLSQEALTWITTTFTDGNITTDLNALETDYDITDVIEAMYPETKDETLEMIANLDFGSFSTATQNNRNANDVVTEFLSKTPFEGRVAREVYLPATKQMLDIVLNPRNTEEDKSTELQKMATSLGNCSTPVKSFLIQNKVNKQLSEEASLTPLLENLLDREAVEDRINTVFKDKFKSGDKIEMIQAMVDSIFMEGAERYQHNTNLRITGERPRLESKTINQEYGFRNLPDDAASIFAKLFCETNNENALIKNTTGEYVLDPPKLKSITSAYRARFAIISAEERVVSEKTASYNMEVTALLNNDDLMENTTEPDVALLLDIPSQQEELRVALFRTPESERDATYDRFLQDQKTKIRQAIQKYAPQKVVLPGLLNPMNDGRRSPSPDGGGKRKATPSQNEASQNKRSRSPG
ncbi:leucine-rich repeat domain-containing protein [Ascidiimonas sp. W6]|uniref:leucine-rich repeat domain-containing protein n=1 Tax=Ascidiimonas meishanensis TaxID=3128903 RepID=UPI0030EF99EB